MEEKDYFSLIRSTFQKPELMILVVDKDGNIKFVNQNMMKTISPNNMKKKNVTQISHEISEAFIEILSHSKSLIRKEFRRNGELFVGEVFPVSIKGDLLCAIGFFWKVNEVNCNKEIMTRCMASTRLFEIIFTSSYDGLWIMDDKGIVLRINKAAERIADIKAKDIVGKSVKQLREKNMFDRSVTLEVLKRKSQVTLIQNVKQKKKVLLTGTPVFDDQGNIEFIVVNDRDISELILLKDQLEDAKAISNSYCMELSNLNMKKVEGIECVFRCEAMQKILETVYRVSKVDSTVLISGESGVGKGVIARMIHKLSNRKKGPFIKLNCGSIPETLIESELFGYEKGAFTGAHKAGKIGLIELANNGALFLDEIGTIPVNMQSKLLQFLESNEVFRVGGVKAVNLNVRFISATNENLRKMIKQGKFREDLFYRLNVIPIHIPPLRERKEDIPALIIHFLDKYNKKFNKNKAFRPSLIDFLFRYEFPGNIRELSNLVERLVVLTEKNKVGVKDLPGELISPENVTNNVSLPIGKTSLKEMIERTEKIIITNALKQYESQRKAAKALRIDQSTLVRKVRKHKICTGVISH